MDPREVRKLPQAEQDKIMSDAADVYAQKFTSETNPPPFLPSHAKEWARSLDPWHRDAFPPELAHAAPNQSTPRDKGWMLYDWVGNPLHFVPDGVLIENLVNASKKEPERHVQHHDND